MFAFQPNVTSDQRHPDMRLFFTALSPDDTVANDALNEIVPLWRDGYAGVFWDMLRFLAPPQRVNDGVRERQRRNTEPSNGIASEITPQENPSTKIWRRLMGYL